MAKFASEEIHLGFETQGRHHQKSKIGVSVAIEEALMSSKDFFKKKKSIDVTESEESIPHM